MKYFCFFCRLMTIHTINQNCQEELTNGQTRYSALCNVCSKTHYVIIGEE